MNDDVDAQDGPALSVVCAVFNEERAISRLLDLLSGVLTTLGISFELIMVDDGSTDATLERLKAAIGSVPHLRIVQLYRNYGQVAAVSAGISLACGAWIVMIDGDLQ